jgi:anaerobic magnesium-protoporphyrin IX monomethyl ester cyclase
MRGGLTHVYMGVESGDEQGLRNLNKMLEPEAHIRAGEILKRLSLSFDFGFMLLEPYSTIESARNNVAFLERFVGDGWSVASFCRMLPYAGAPVTECLRREGRLRGTPFDPDYDFLDPKLDIFYNWMLATFHTRNFTSAGLSQLLRSINFEARLRLASQNGMSLGERAWFKHVTALCNRTAFHVLREALAHIDATHIERLQEDDRKLRELTRFELAEEERLTREILQVYGAYRARMGTTRPVDGGFDRSWTLRQADHEAAGVGSW